MRKKGPFGSVSVIAHIHRRVTSLKSEDLVNKWSVPWDGKPGVAFVGEATDQMKRLLVVWGQLHDQMEPLSTRAAEIEAFEDAGQLTAALVEEHTRLAVEHDHLDRARSIVGKLLILEIRMAFPDVPNGQRVAIDDNWRVGWSRRPQVIFQHTVSVIPLDDISDAA